MYYYQFNLRDYLARTRHLSPMEDLAYRRLLDAYYTEEGPLPSDAARCARLIALPDQVEAVDLVLNEFFSLSEHGWHNQRCDEEIAKFRAKSERARNASDKRWHSGSDAKGNAKSILKRNADAMPTNNQEPETNTPHDPLKGFDEFWSVYPRKEAKANAAKAWAKLKPSDELIEQIISHVKVRATTPKWQEQGGAFVPHGATFINQQRWTDPIPNSGFNWDNLGD